jgi:serine/threonine protein kinase
MFISENGQKVDCAVKRLSMEVVGDALDKISNEIELMVMVDHENLLKAYTHEITEEFIYIALERCDTDLKKILDMIQVIGHEQEAARIIGMILQAMTELQRMNIVHRDLKPENVLFRGGAGGQLKICDFGCAKQMSEGQESTSTKMVEGVGSIAYAAPEFKFDKSGYTPKSEMWSIGIMLVEMLFGHHEMQMVLKDVRTANNKKAPFQLVLPEEPAISPDCTDVLVNLLQVDPEKRMSLEQLIVHKFLNTDAVDEGAIEFKHLQAGISEQK